VHNTKLILYPDPTMVGVLPRSMPTEMYLYVDDSPWRILLGRISAQAAASTISRAVGAIKRPTISFVGSSVAIEQSD
jgi:hypothetical protein